MKMQPQAESLELDIWGKKEHPKKSSSKCTDKKEGKYNGLSDNKEDAHLAEANWDWMMESWDRTGSSHSRVLFLMVSGVPRNKFALVSDRKITGWPEGKWN